MSEDQPQDSDLKLVARTMMSSVEAISSWRESLERERAMEQSMISQVCDLVRSGQEASAQQEKRHQDDMKTMMAEIKVIQRTVVDIAAENKALVKCVGETVKEIKADRQEIKADRKELDVRLRSLEDGQTEIRTIQKTKSDSQWKTWLVVAGVLTLFISIQTLFQKFFGGTPNP